MGEVLARHNMYRARHHAPPLVWDERLAASAQAWANQCTFDHSRPGENLAMGSDMTPAEGVDMWYNEVSGWLAWLCWPGHIISMSWLRPHTFQLAAAGA